MANIKDVAERAGVSISTVSNVINGTKYVSSELKQRIQQAIDELRYEVDPLARSLKSKRTMTLGVVITNINRIFFPQVLSGIQERASANGYSLNFYTSNDRFEAEQKYIQLMESNQVDGIILDSVADTDNKEYFTWLSRLGTGKKAIPIVSIERRLENYGIDSVAVNNRLGAAMITRHLTECGCRNIAHISGPTSSCMAADRLSGYKDELESLCLPVVDGMLLEGDYSPLSGYQAVKKLLSTGKPVDGIFAANDQMAVGAIKAVRESGLRIPEDIRISGFDNTFASSIVEPALTTIQVPRYKMGDTAVELLLHRIEKPETKAVYCELPIQMVIRQSTDLKGDKSWDLYGW